MDWAIGGINMSITKYAGEECIQYVNFYWLITETAIILAACAYLFYWSLPKDSLPQAFMPFWLGFLINLPIAFDLLAMCIRSQNYSWKRGVKTQNNYSPGNLPRQCKLPTISYNHKDRVGRRVLLVLLCLCWGMEIGFKCASKTLIYLMNPCHITTALQIYLLTAKPSKTVTAIFRLHLNYLNGPLLAIVFYETETRLLPLEATVYWAQHLMMFVVPYYLIRIGGVYNIENVNEMQWNVMAYSFLVAYHFTVLQAVSVLTNINMNHIMCPLDSDPFRGQFFRTGVFFHQAFLSILICKLYIIVSHYFLTKCEYTKIKKTLNCDIDVALRDKNNKEKK